MTGIIKTTEEIRTAAETMTKPEFAAWCKTILGITVYTDESKVSMVRRATQHCDRLTISLAQCDF